MPTHNAITCVVRYVDKPRPNISSELQTIYFYQYLVSSSVIKYPYHFLPLCPNIPNLPLQYIAIQILWYSNKKSSFNPFHMTHHQPSIYLNKFHDNKMIVRWKYSIQASIAGKENFKPFKFRPQHESMMIMAIRKKFVLKQNWSNQEENNCFIGHSFRNPPLMSPRTNITWRPVK